MRNEVNKHFIEAYKEFHDQITSTDPRFPEMLAVAAMGFSLGRENSIPILPEKVCHNFYIVLIGSAALSHKSTAVKQVFLKLIDNKYRAPHFFSPEVFYHYISENPKIILYFDEFDIFLNRMKRKYSYMSMFTNSLSSFYDCPEEFTVQSNQLMERNNPEGKLHIENVYPFVIGCITMEELKKHLDPKIIKRGIFTRFLFIIATEVHFNALRMVEEWKMLEIKKKTEILQEYLKKLSKTRVVFSWEEEARKHVGDYITTLIERYKNNGMSKAVIGRSEVNIIKMANIYALNEVEIPEIKEQQQIKAEVNKTSAQKAVTFIGKCIKDAIEIHKIVS